MIKRKSAAGPFKRSCSNQSTVPDTSTRLDNLEKELRK
jgi:hypothetical protein